MKIRLSNKLDAQRVYEVWKASVEATHHFLTEKDFEEISDQVIQYSQSASFFLAEEESRVIAFMGLSDSHIDSLFVDPNYFGTGVGKLLVNHAKSLYASLTVDVNEDNSGACMFYKKMGFKVIERSPTDSDGRPYPILKLSLKAVDNFQY